MFTKKEVAQNIGWLDAMSDDIEFDSADWSSTDEDGIVYLEGRARDGGDFVAVTVQITEVEVSPAEPVYDEDY